MPEYERSAERSHAAAPPEALVNVKLLICSSSYTLFSNRSTTTVS